MLSMHFSNYNNHLASARKYSSSHSFCVCSSWLLLDVFLPLLDFSLVYLATFSLSLSPCFFPVTHLSPVSFPVPCFPAAVGFRWMVPTVQDLDLRSSDRLSQCPVVLLTECIPRHSAHIGANTAHTHAHTQGYRAIVQALGTPAYFRGWEIKAMYFIFCVFWSPLLTLMTLVNSSYWTGCH